jgi:ABC-type polysaccharide/polyol phosphate transport system ATPase subunit
MAYAVEVNGLSKRFRIGERGTDSLMRQLIGRMRGERAAAAQYLWALDDVSFQVREGEICGIVGRNGSGKSTLLKILAGIMRPTRGSAVVRGRVGALLEVGTGFHPDLTGRENVYFNGTLLGMSREFIRSKFDEIVDFSGIEKFIDTPVKHYSSGMHTRLAFAVSVNLRPEVLILDEVLTVGDQFFQEKCVEKVDELTRSGITVLYVSHSTGTVASICKHAILLDRGRITAAGRPYQVLTTYVTRDDVQEAEASFDGSAPRAYVVDARLGAEPVGDAGRVADDARLATGGSADPAREDGRPDGDDDAAEEPDGRESNSERVRELSARFLGVTAEREDGTATSEFDLYEDIYFRIRYRVDKPLHLFQVVLVIRAGFEHVLQTYDTDDESVILDHPLGVFERRVKVDRFFLKEGRYAITLQCGTQTELIDSHIDALRFDVVCRRDDPNMEYRSYRRDRPGKVIFHGAWLGDREPQS